jgi:acyl carrier protein
MNVVDTVRKLIGDVCGVEAKKIRADVHLAEYGLDSVRAMDLLVSLEEQFEIQIPDEFAARIQTVEEIVSYVTRHIPAHLRDVAPSAFSVGQSN